MLFFLLERDFISPPQIRGVTRGCSRHWPGEWPSTQQSCSYCAWVVVPYSGAGCVTGRHSMVNFVFPARVSCGRLMTVFCWRQDSQFGGFFLPCMLFRVRVSVFCCCWLSCFYPLDFYYIHVSCVRR